MFQLRTQNRSVPCWDLSPVLCIAYGWDKVRHKIGEQIQSYFIEWLELEEALKITQFQCLCS